MIQKIFLVILVTVFIGISTPRFALALENSLSKGDTINNFSLPSISGETVTLYDLLKEKNVILTFYRGGWCPICNIQLQRYQSHIELEALNATLVAVSPETVSNANETSENNNLKFHVLVDHDNKLAKELGILWEIPASDRKGFEQWLQQSTGKTLEEFNGQKSYDLPVPATFVINQNAVVEYAFKDVNYRKRAKAEDIVKTLKNLQ